MLKLQSDIKPKTKIKTQDLNSKTPGVLGFIKTDEKNYEINLAVAGFNENEIEIVSMQNILSITGKKNQNNVQNIIHKGIALRPFEKKFNLDPLMEVTEAILSQGMLNIKLFKRDPEIIQPKKIEIKTT